MKEMCVLVFFKRHIHRSLKNKGREHHPKGRCALILVGKLVNCTQSSLVFKKMKNTAKRKRTVEQMEKPQAHKSNDALNTSS